MSVGEPGFSDSSFFAASSWSLELIHRELGDLSFHPHD
jgi:hypothetical protein